MTSLCTCYCIARRYEVDECSLSKDYNSEYLEKCTVGAVELW